MNILKIALNAGALGKKEGQEEAPDHILKSTEELYMNESRILPILNIEDVDVDNSDFEGSCKKIFEKVNALDSFSILLGGDHSLTYPAFKAFAQNNDNPGLVIFDAHPDLMDNFKTHEDYLKSLIEDKILNPKNVIIVGVRNWEQSEIEYLRDKKIKFFTMKNITEEGIHDISDTVMSNARRWGSLYISIDIDAVDPAFAPGTGHIEPGGLSSRELIYFLQRLKNLQNLKMADIVEVNPKKDVNQMTSKLAAKIIWELG